MDHPMTIRANDGKVREFGNSLRVKLRKRLQMVALREPLSMSAISGLKSKPQTSQASFPVAF